VTAAKSEQLGAQLKELQAETNGRTAALEHPTAATPVDAEGGEVAKPTTR